jgi:hypothetical protein
MRNYRALRRSPRRLEHARAVTRMQVLAGWRVEAHALLLHA